VASGWLQGLVFLAYPLIVYAAVRWLDPRGVGLVLLALYTGMLLYRARARLGELAALLRQHVGIALLILAGVWTQDRRVLQLLPVLVNLYLLASFGSSLVAGPPMIERFARLIEGDLPAFTHPYCRKVTALWCLFFAANAALIGYLAFFASLEWWTLYTGLLFYLVLAGLQAIEFVVRKLWFRYYPGGFADRVFARYFPPERTANGRRSLAYQAARAH